MKLTPGAHRLCDEVARGETLWGVRRADIRGGQRRLRQGHEADAKDTLGHFGGTCSGGWSGGTCYAKPVP